MKALARRICNALEHVVARDSASRAVPVSELRDLEIVPFQLSSSGFQGQFQETLLIDVSDAVSDQNRLKRVDLAIRRSGLDHAVVVSDSLAAVPSAQRTVGGTEFVRLNAPWAAIPIMPEDSAIPGDVNPDRFESEYLARTARLIDSDGHPRVGNADEQMKEWLADSAAGPLIVTGIRGVGKTWQLIHFCRTSWDTFVGSKGENSPAIYIYLGNADVAQLLVNGSPGGHAVSQLLRAHYGTIQLPWNGMVLGALVDTGAVAIALDGFDEVYKQPSDEQVRSLGRSLLQQFASGARFVVSGRSAFVNVLAEPTVNRLSAARDQVGRRVTTLELLPIDSARGAGFEERGRLLGVTGLLEALGAADGHPALRAEIRRLSGNSAADARAIRNAVLNVFVEFNLRHERTREVYARRGVAGEFVQRTFSARDRVGFLSELSWYMAERGLSSISVDRLPRRLAKQFELDSEAMRMDVRSQLVLEQTAASNGSDAATVSFAIGLESDAGADGVGHTLTGSVFLGEFLYDRVAEALSSPKLGLYHFLRFLGRVPLTRSAALFLRARLTELEATTRRPVGKEIRTQAVELLQTLAMAGGGRVFIACLRHLVPNLERLGVFESSEASAWNPWAGEALSVDDRMVVVPAITSPPTSRRLSALVTRPDRRLERSLRGKQPLVPREPYLIGVHEVTNALFEAFVWSPEGEEWRVRRITRAGSAHGSPPSPFAGLTNEYHLYFWEEHGGPRGYHPARGSADLPVTYVSWHATAAYCDWLSGRAPGRVREYGFLEDRVESGIPDGAPGFRLPSLCEWLWAASVGIMADNDPLPEYPWDWLAPGVPLNELPPELRRRQVAMADTQLESGKQLSAVLEDEILDSGVSGLVGNVKEWVDDSEVDPDEQVESKRHVIAGATAYLGKDSFKFGYYVSLFSQNTNPDVGFRIARSLDASELRKIKQRERQLVELGNRQRRSN